MPLVRIALHDDHPTDDATIGEGVHRAMIAALGIPAGDRFQLITRYPAKSLDYDHSFLDIPRDDRIVIIEITMATGRSTAVKKSLYAAIADTLRADAGIPPADVFIALYEVPPQNFSFGNGQAQFADELPPHLRQGTSR
jgi:phenylpyruvate tautomerase PptA (4-oxalocrotonate tautomerase family)